MSQGGVGINIRGEFGGGHGSGENGEALFVYIPVTCTGGEKNAAIKGGRRSSELPVQLVSMIIPGISIRLP